MQSIMFWVHLKLQEVRDREDGATAVEYGLMVGLIAVAIIATVILLGEQLNGVFQQITTELADIVPAPAPAP